jgi:uncharacterized repeat protein (TIGR01451 family)
VAFADGSFALSGADSGSTVTVTAPGAFELRWNAATGGGIDQFFDLADDPGRTLDLAGGSPVWNSQPALFIDRLWYDTFSAPAAPTSHYGWSAGDAVSGDSRLELIETTVARAKVRQDAYYHHTLSQGRSFRVPALQGRGDYAIYPVGRLALAWSRRAFGPVTWGGGAASLGAADLEWVVHRDGAVPALSLWSAYRAGNPSPFLPNTDAGPGSGADDFLLLQNLYTVTTPNATTDFLAILYDDWVDAQVTEYRDTSAGADKAAWAAWNDNRTGPVGPHVRSWTAGQGETFHFLTSFRPKSYFGGSDLEAANRLLDYRSPATVAIVRGTRWADPAENSAGAGDFFNEADASYVFDADPLTGLAFDLAAPPTRYRPFFKIRQWRSLLPPGRIQLEGSPLYLDADYRAAVKPVARAHFVPSLGWHCTFESLTACDPGTLDVGGSGSAALVGAIVPGRYGNAAEFTQDSHHATAGTAGSADFSPAIGAVELWYQPYSNHDDNARHLLWFNSSGSAPDFSCLGLEKEAAANQLRFVAFVNYADAGCTTPDGNSSVHIAAASAASYGWRARDWVHIVSSWNAGAGPRKMRLLVSGVEVASSASFVAPAASGPTVFGGCQGPICPGGPGNAGGLIDEPHVYTSLTGADEVQAPFAHAGLLSDAREFLADPGDNTAIGLVPVDGFFRGHYLYIGADAKFHGLNVDLAIPGSGASPAGLVWEYWDGTRWASLTTGGTFTDTTQSFQTSGKLFRDLDPPGWAPVSVAGGPDLYYWRAYLVAPAYTTVPVERQIKTDILLFQHGADVTVPDVTFDFAPAADADLGIAKTDFQSDAVPGSFVSYAVTVTNNGPDTVTRLFVSDPLPASIISPAYSPSTGSYDSVTGEWTGLAVNVNDSVVLTISGTIDPFARGTLTNTASVSPAAGTNDGNPANDVATDVDTLTPAVDVQVTKIDDLDPVPLGGLVTYTITVANAGPSGATSVTVTDPLPPGMELDAGAGAIATSQGTCSYLAGPRTVSCALGDLAPASVATVTVKVRGQAVGTHTNNATATRTETDTVAGNDSDGEPTTVELSTNGVVVLTATSRFGQNVLEWINPTSAAYLRTEVVRRPDTFPTGPGDGFVVYDSGAGGSGGRVKITDGGLTNGQTYYYGAFVHRTAAPLVSAGRFVTGRPFDPTAGPVKWAFSTGATALTPPTVGGAGVIAPSNDGKLYAMQRGAAAPGGEWPTSFEPIDVGVVQGRSPVVPILANPNPVIYLGSQNGTVYAIDAADGGSSPLLWAYTYPVAGAMVQAAPGGIFGEFGGTLDLVLVGTRNGSAPNAYVALDPVTGVDLEVFDNGGGPGPGELGIITGTAAIEYGPPVYAYFTGYERTPVGSTLTLRAFELKASPDPVFNLAWGRALGNIDSSPVVRDGRVYVGSPLGGGTLYSIDAIDGNNTALDRTFAHGDGQVRGFVWPDRSGSGDLYFATDNLVWGVTDTGAALVGKFAPITLAAGVTPSAVLFTPGSHYVYVGGSDGKLYEIDVLPPVPTVKSVTLGDGSARVGTPSLDRGGVPNLLHVGTEAGIFYAVQVPLP